MPGKLTDLIGVASNQLALQCATLIEDAIFLSLESLAEREPFRWADVPNLLNASLNRQGNDTWMEYRFDKTPLFQFRVIFEKGNDEKSLKAVGDIRFIDPDDDEKGRERKVLRPPGEVGQN